MENLENLNPTAFTISSILVGLLLIGDLDALEQNSLGNWFMLVGQILETNCAQQQLIEGHVYPGSININSKVNKDVYNPIIYDLNKLQNILNTTSPNNINNVVNILQKTVNILQLHINDLKK